VAWHVTCSALPARRWIVPVVRSARSWRRSPNEIRKQLTWSAERASPWHFRDHGGAEVDFVLEHSDGRVCGIEVKATSTPRAEDLHGLRYLADRLSQPRFSGQHSATESWPPHSAFTACSP